MDITDYRVSKIENHSLLLEVMFFLKKGFNLSELFEHNYLEYLCLKSVMALCFLE